MAFCQSPGFGFCQLSKWKERPCQLFLCERIQYIALILTSIKCFFQNIAFSVVLDTGIVSCCYSITGKRLGAFVKLFKFEISVAVDTWVGCSPRFIALDKRVNYTIIKRFCKIEHIIGHSQMESHTSRILHVIQRAAGFFRLQRQYVAAVQLHGTANACKPLFLQQQRRHTAVYATAHGNQNFFHFASLLHPQRFLVSWMSLRQRIVKKIITFPRFSAKTFCFS